MQQGIGLCGGPLAAWADQVSSPIFLRRAKKEMTVDIFCSGIDSGTQLILASKHDYYDVGPGIDPQP
jgi:hypothetical protein